MTGEEVAALVREAIEATPGMPPRTPRGTWGARGSASAPAHGPGRGRARTTPVPVPGPDDFLARLRATYPDWAIVADLRGGRWAAANWVTEIWRESGIGLAQALEAATGAAPSEGGVPR